jgi:hypothetical protein
MSELEKWIADELAKQLAEQQNAYFAAIQEANKRQIAADMDAWIDGQLDKMALETLAIIIPEP